MGYKIDIAFRRDLIWTSIRLRSKILVLISISNVGEATDYVNHN